MKPETLIYEKVRKVIPEKSEKTIFFAAVSKTSYEVFFYTFMGGEPRQCFALAEEGQLDENILDEVFEAIAVILRESKVFAEDKYNIATIRVDKSGIKMDVEFQDKDVRMYKIKKEWEQRNLAR